MTPVFLTIDTEYAWRHHEAGLSSQEIHRRSIEPGGVGIAYQLGMLARYDLKACFFVDALPGLIHGMEPFARLAETILTAGQEVQLHLHPHWTRASLDDRRAHASFYFHEYDADAQRELIERGLDLFARIGVPRPVAFRAGNYAADDRTLAALSGLGFRYDSSHNGAETGRLNKIGLPARQIAPVERGVVEIPVTVIEEPPGRLRIFQPCSLSKAEAKAAIDHASAHGHAALTIVSHSFELANRAGTAPNAVHVARFEALCAMLAERRDELPTVHFRDTTPLRLDAEDRPLGANPVRRRLRQIEQLWSNWVAERGLSA